MITPDTDDGLPASDEDGSVAVVDGSGPRRLGVLASLLLIFGAFVAMQIPMAIGMSRAGPAVGAAGDYVSFWDSNTWGRYDTWHYLDIAKAGYAFEKCTDGIWSPDDWCG